MNYLLDTHTLLCWLYDDPQLSRTARGIIADPANAILVSSASAWEIAIKQRLGKLPSATVLVRDMDRWLLEARFRELPISIAHGRQAGSWPQPHRDPFDRMLAAQSAIEQLPLLSKDPELSSFGILVVW